MGLLQVPRQDGNRGGANGEGCGSSGVEGRAGLQGGQQDMCYITQSVNYIVLKRPFLTEL